MMNNFTINKEITNIFQVFQQAILLGTELSQVHAPAYQDFFMYEF